MSADYTQQLRQAVKAIDKLQARVGELEAALRHTTEPVAVIGIGCRFPGASGPDEFWDLLANGTDAIREVPPDRWRLADYYDADPSAPGKISTRFGGFIDGLSRFDAELFGIAPREAVSMDPQHRLLLEVSWEALEHAGLSPLGLAGSRTGVFVGICSTDYAQLLAARGNAAIDAYLGSGTAHSTATGRVSYTLGLEGPNFAIDTACSSSLVAVHQACAALRTGECDLALAGGVNAMVTPTVSITFTKARMLAADGRCKTFDASADGYGRGEGCGIVVLKRLADAHRDGDPVLAVVRGSAVNQDGASSGLTVPNGPSQERVIREALRQARVEPRDVAYLEAHGTGTSLGDPIEVQAAAAVFSQGRDVSRPLLIGSVKTNIGHLEAAAGIAGFIKTVLALDRGEIPKALHFRTPNPHIAWEWMPVRVATVAAPWPQGRKIAGVSAFGFSGTNAHVVLEGGPADPPAAVPPARASHILPLAAKNVPALLESARRYRTWLEAHSEADLSDFCYTVAAGRAPLEERAAMVVECREDALRRLDALISDAKVPAVWRGAVRTPPKSAWLFTGQGSQYPGMARELYNQQPVFRSALDRCAGILSAEFQLPLLGVMFDGDTSAINDTRIAQPAIFAVEMALAELWKSWGIQPDIVLGHSVGQYAAACVAGAFSLEDGLRLIAHRGRLMGALPRVGKMAAIFATASTVRNVVADYPDLAIAADNGSHTVISGKPADVDAVVAVFEARGAIAKPLATSHAFHSVLLEPALDEFEAIARRVNVRPAERTLICNLTGRALAAGQVLDAAYWRRHARHAVEFSRSVSTLAELGCRTLVEVGPDTVLAPLARRCWPKSSDAPVCVSSLRRDHSDAGQLANALAQLFVAGAVPDFAAWDRPWRRRKLHLPTYPFQRRTYWIESPRRSEDSVASFYDAVGATPLGQQGPAFLTFGPLSEPLEGFSWLLTWAEPEKHPEHAKLVIEAQKRLRAALFHHVPFDKVTRALDFGCGLAADAISLAKAHHHLKVDGYTISAEQVAEGTRRAEANGVSGRVSIFHADSSKDPFPGRYQLIFGFEVAHYIREKARLFSNVQEHLEENGTLVLADFLSTADVAIEHQGTGSYFSNLREWVDLLSAHGLVLVEAIDISREVGNFLRDPEFEAHFAQLMERFPGTGAGVGAAVRSYHQLGRMLHRNIARYMLLTARRDSIRTREELARINTSKLSDPVPYSTWQNPQPIYEIEWQPHSLSSALADAAPAAWAIFSDGGPTARLLGSSLRSYGQHPFAATDLADVPLEHPLAGLVYCCTATADAEAILKSVLDLLQACDRSDRFRGVPLWLITCGAHRVTDADLAVNPATAALWGLGRAIARERSTPVRMVDLGSPDSGTELLLLTAEMTGPGPEEELALRGSEVLLPRLVRWTGAANPENVPVRSDSAYLVTGATGGLGLASVKWLAGRGARAIVGVARRAPSATIQLQFDALRDNGCDIRCVEADVSDAAAMARLLGEIRAEFPLRGVIHAAGVVDDALLPHQDWSRFAAVLQPKVRGAQLLDELTRRDGLDFFVFYSSLTAVLGAPGQANYVAANAFLDGLAHARRQAGLPALSINWGLWGDGGMASRSPSAVEQYQRRGGILLYSSQAFAALESLLDADRTQAAIAPMDWARFAAAAEGRIPAPARNLVPALPTGPPLSPIRDLLRKSAPQQRRDVLKRFLQQQVADVLQLETLPDPDAGFFDLGMDSLMAVEFRNHVQTALELDPPPPATIAFDHPTVSQLAAKLAPQLLDLPAAPQPAAPVPRAATDHASEDIAIVGFSCRFPGAAGPEEFRDLLEQGRDAIGEIPPDRWNAAAFYDPDPAAPGRMSTRFGGFIDGIDRFDAAFFGISPREAAALDPQQRLLLEISWEALERAGLAPARLAGSRTGVFIGISTHDYFQMLAHRPEMQNESLLSIGNAFSTAAGRISHFLGLHGPCAAIDTACSSSLVAVSHACDNLRSARCDLALAAGVNAILNPAVMVNLSKTGMMAPGGRCLTFDAAAEGYVRGEGCGVVLLKRLSDARRDGDRIWAVIRGTAVNHDGAASGLTVPNGPAQERVIRDALERARVAPADVVYLEAHGTGTPLGDPIEVQAAAAVYGEGRDPARPLLIGSAKTNIGHLEAAAGIAGLLKVVFALQSDRIPRHLHFHTPNPHLDWSRLPVRVVDRPAEWPAGRRLAAVSSFGFSGTNAHIVLEGPQGAVDAEAPVLESAGPTLLMLSARSRASLAEVARRYRDWLEAHPDIDVREFCAALATQRNHFEERAAAAVATRAEALAILEALERGGARTPAAKERPHTVWFFADAPVAEHLAAAARWRALGVEPDTVWGEGAGAIAAACVAEVFSPEDALRIAAGAAHEVERKPAQRTLLDGSPSETPVLMEFGAAAPGNVVASLRLRADGNNAQIADCLARLYTAGWSPNASWTGAPKRRLTLPTYPFEKRRHWLAESAPEPAGAPLPSAAPAGNLPLRAHIAALVQHALALEGPPDPAADFLELGMDSMIATELTRRLQEELGLKLTSTVVLDHRNIEKLAAHLEQSAGSNGAGPSRKPVSPTPIGAPGLAFWQRFRAPAAADGVGPAPIELGPGATLRIYPPSPDVPVTGAGIVICPGGGYATLGMDTEGHQVAAWLNSAGIAAFVVGYRLAPAHRYPAPLEDVRRAMQYVRSHANSLAVSASRIGLMGFSAGGHLAALAAAERDAEHRPDFLILGYPVISMLEHCNVVTRRNLLGENPPPELLESVSAERLVHEDMPPVFLFHTGEDAAVVVEHTLAFYAALRRAKVPVEMHTYQHGPHGVGLAPGDPVLGTWKDRLLDWIRANGLLCGAERATVQGEIAFGGEPLGFGTITFVPESASASTLPIAWGHIVLGKYHIPAGRGPVPGAYVVEIRMLGALGPRPTIEAVRLLARRSIEIQSGENTFSLTVAQAVGAGV